MRRINEAEGKAAEIESVATATASGINQIAAAIQAQGGTDAVNLRIAEQYIQEFGKLAKETNTVIIPNNLSDIAGVITAAKSVIEKTAGK